MEIVIIIPARIGSTRFPEKPLQKIGGIPLLSRVIGVAKNAASVVPGLRYAVATDHADIAALAEKSGAMAIMTDPGLASGTDRAFAASQSLEKKPDFIINLQGDAPFTPVDYITRMIAMAEQSYADVFTPVTQLSWQGFDTLRMQKKKHAFSGTTCVRLSDGKAVWFSKNLMPAIRKEHALRETNVLSPVFRHIGLYGYHMAALEKFVSLPVGRYETLEGLEQLRFLENDMSIQTFLVEQTPLSMWGIDTPDDAKFAEELLAKYGDPH